MTKVEIRERVEEYISSGIAQGLPPGLIASEIFYYLCLQGVAIKEDGELPEMDDNFLENLAGYTRWSPLI